MAANKMKTKIETISQQNDIEIELVKIVAKNLLEEIIGDVDNKPHPFNLFRWTKFGKRVWSNYMDLRNLF